MNGYTAMLQQEKRAFQQRLKEEKIMKELEAEREANFRAAMIHAEFIAERKAITAYNEKCLKKAEFMHKYKNPNYRQYLIVWDLVNDDIPQIKSDYQREKISFTDLCNMLESVPDEILHMSKEEILNYITLVN